MKKLYFLFFLMIGFLGNAQIVNIPDNGFKTMLLSASPNYDLASTQTPIYNSSGYYTVSTHHTIDTNGDGEIQVTEAQAIKWLILDSQSIISNLIGIEAFTNLEYFNCSNKQLTSLNISSLTNLKSLICYDNQLTNLNVSGLTNLQFLYCYGNQLTNLNVSGLTNLQLLSYGGNQLTNLNVSGLTNLYYLECDNNQLTNLDVSGLTNLQELHCSSNQLTNLDVSGLTNLQNLNCVDNQLTNLNVSGLTNLYWLSCFYNELSSLDVSGLTNLHELQCSDNQLTSLDVSGLTNLYELYCYDNQLTSLDVSGLTNLQKLDCYNNQLTSLNIKNNNSNWDGLGFINNPNLQYICVDEGDQAMVQQMINSYGYTSTCNVNSYCSFTPGGTFYEISGNTKFDSNSNGCDVSDINFPNLKFSITNGTNSSSFIANQSGNNYFPVSAGNHILTPNLENPTYFNISPTNFSVNFPTQASPFIQNFCVTANGVHSDVEIVLVPTTPARPGFNAYYKLVYRNKGNQIENGTVTFSMYNPDVVDFVSSLPNFNSQTINPTLETFLWNYSNLQPFETREIYIVLNINSPMETPPVNGGDLLSFDAQIGTSFTDENLNDNYFEIRQVVVNSYDPNDKTCLQGETIPPSEVGKYVHYVIRFENTGTYPAENIVVKDMINLAKYDIATLVPLNSSHDFYTRINGNKVEFIFENINLDFNDATNDGYVAFKIKTKPTLVVGNTFSNNANIYFDYNFPITTNTYTTTVVALSTQDFDFGTYFTLYPNPAKDVLNIQTKQDLQVNSIEIYNQLGQIVLAVTNAVNSIDVADLASGTYFLKVNTEKGSANSKFVKE